MLHFLLISFITLFAVSKIITQFFGRSKASYEQMKIIYRKVSATLVIGATLVVSATLST